MATYNLIRVAHTISIIVVGDRGSGTVRGARTGFTANREDTRFARICCCSVVIAGKWILATAHLIRIAHAVIISIKIEDGAGAIGAVALTDIATQSKCARSSIGGSSVVVAEVFSTTAISEMASILNLLGLVQLPKNAFK